MTLSPEPPAALAEEPAPSAVAAPGTRMPTVAIAGNPNCGKTSIFNALTGSRHHVGNWPGVTVERRTAIFEAGRRRGAGGGPAGHLLPLRPERG